MGQYLIKQRAGGRSKWSSIPQMITSM